MDAGTPSENEHVAFVTVGAARLPRSIAGELSDPLVVELTVDGDSNRIVDVATSISLPGYMTVLRRFLIGSRMDDLDSVVERISEHYRGPFLRPTIAALRSAAANNGKDT